MEERRKAFNARESLQGEYPTPEQRHREVNQAFAIAILGCVCLCLLTLWIVGMRDRASRPPTVVIRGQGVERTIIGEDRYVTREDTFVIDKDTGEKYYFVMVRGNTK